MSFRTARFGADLPGIECLTDRDGQLRGDPLTMKLYDDWRVARQTVLRRRTMVGPTEIPDTVRASIRRVFGEDLDPRDAVERILADVHRRGDRALREWTSRIEGVELGELEVPAGDLQVAYENIPSDLADGLRLADERIREFHSNQPVRSWSMAALGGTLGQRVTPLARVGVYVPGGTAPLPSVTIRTHRSLAANRPEPSAPGRHRVSFPGLTVASGGPGVAG